MYSLFSTIFDCNINKLLDQVGNTKIFFSVSLRQTIIDHTQQGLKIVWNYQKDTEKCAKKFDIRAFYIIHY